MRLTTEAYQAVEDAYIVSAEAFLQEAGVAKLAVTGLESPRCNPPISEGEWIVFERVGDVLRALLREKYWCRLKGKNAFVHVGWDYYMYVGIPRECPGAEATAKAHGLYVEEFASPYVQYET